MASMARTERAITACSLCAGTITLTKGQSPWRGGGTLCAGSQRQRNSSAVVIQVMLVTMG